MIVFLSNFSIFFISTLLVFLTQPTIINAGSYTDSAHGDNAIGVNRAVTSDKGYARGNCSHCHVQHSSISGSEPNPADGANSFALFSSNFDKTKETNPYTEEDNFCFSCHSFNAGSGQSVINYDYSRSFGCGTDGESNILSAMNQLSYHNLFDVYTYAKDNFSWFTEDSNPCNACHNPHLAKDNADNPQDSSFSAISKPNDHFTLYGDDVSETIGNNFGNSYEPVFCDDAKTTREPGASNDAIAGRANAIDYVAFCTACHTPTADIYSSTLGRNLRKIDWRDGGDKHGIERAEQGGNGALLRPPYTINSNYVVSCIDCHEPHGSQNVMLLRRRTNGSNLVNEITQLDQNISWGKTDIDNIGYLCLNCHYDDLTAKEDGVAASNQTAYNHWRIAHHASGTDTPFNGAGGALNAFCGVVECHGGGVLPGPKRPICTDCHFHGSVHTIIYGNSAGQGDSSTRKTF